MEIVDLSVAMSEGMPKFPAEWFPSFRVVELDDPEEHWSRRFTTIELCAHCGTHVESSGHVVRDGATIDTVPLGSFAGFPTIVDLRDIPERSEVPRDVVQDRLPEDHIPPREVVLLMTGYDDRRWGKADFWERSPWLSPAAAEYIASTGPSLVGLDFQTERPGTRDFAVHRALIARGAVLCEYLFNLERIDVETLFLAIPLRIAGVEAAATRAVGIKGLAKTG
jgi:kynurenine formamidase